MLLNGSEKRVPGYHLQGRLRSLSGCELVVLQLRGSGYTLAQIACILERAMVGVEADLASAAMLLGCGTNWRAAVEVARGDGLIM